MWVSIHNTGLAVQGSSSRCLSRLPRVLPGLEEAVRASWVYSQKVLVIYGFLTRFSSLYRGMVHTPHHSSAVSWEHRGAPATPLFPVCTDSPTAHTDTL